MPAGHGVRHKTLDRYTKIHFRPLGWLQLGPFLRFDPNMDIDDVVQTKERRRPGGRLLPLAKRLASRHGQYKTGEYKKTIQNMQFNSGKVSRVNSFSTARINKKLQGYSYFRLCVAWRFEQTRVRGFRYPWPRSSSRWSRKS